MSAAKSAAPAAPAAEEPSSTKTRRHHRRGDTAVWGIIRLKRGAHARVRFGDIAEMWPKVWVVKVFTAGESPILTREEFELVNLVRHLAPRITGGCKLLFGTEEMSVSDYMANAKRQLTHIIVYCPFEIWQQLKREQSADLEFRLCRNVPQ